MGNSKLSPHRDLYEVFAAIVDGALTTLEIWGLCPHLSEQAIKKAVSRLEDRRLICRTDEFKKYDEVSGSYRVFRVADESTLKLINDGALQRVKP